MSTATALPGITFRVETPPQVTLPRMDIAAFVGFAERGPLHLPVRVEDPAHFRAVFGDAPVLATDPRTGEAQRGCLAGAVRDFFAQGGRRCWVVRVAGAAERNRFPVAGLLAVAPSGYHPAELVARSAGSWSDGVSVGATLLVEPVRLAEPAVVPGGRYSGRVSPPQGRQLQPGDLLQLDGDDLVRAYVRVEEVTVARAPDAPGRWLEVVGSAHWFRGVRQQQAQPGSAEQPGAAGPPWAATLDNLDLRHDGAPPPIAPGDWLLFRPEDDPARHWLLVAEVQADRVSLAGGWREGVLGQATIQRAARVSLTLEACEGAQQRHLLSDLGFCAGHSRYWATLPDDAARYGPADHHPLARFGPDRGLAEGFPLAGADPAAECSLPLGLGLRPVALRGPHHSGLRPLQRDGLVPADRDPYLLDAPGWAEFLQATHLDAALRFVAEPALLAEAVERRHVRGLPLTGIHSLVDIEEISLLALPDAAQRGWRLELRAATPPQPAAPGAPPPPGCPGHDLFVPVPEEQPVVKQDEPPAQAIIGAVGEHWVLLDERDYDPASLLAVQVAATQLAAARADLVAILGLPGHIRPPQALAHRRALAQAFAREREPVASYAALYYPGLIVRAADGALARRGPEGAICGVIAARSRERGAWVAPANVPLRDVLGLVPPPGPDDLAALYGAGINPIQPDPRGFVPWGARTLSADPDLVQLNVRRLMILLRRILLRDGQDHVFAPHSPTFRRQVSLALERLLAGLYARGAFAGASPSEAFRVTLDEALNTRASIEQGRFIVELRVAPARPMSFILVRLIEAGDGTFRIQEG